MLAAPCRSAEHCPKGNPHVIAAPADCGRKCKLGHRSRRCSRRRQQAVGGVLHAQRQHPTIALLLSRDLRADLFEIEPATPYPADYFATVEQATQERERDFLPPPMAPPSGNLAAYDTVFLGFPIWGGFGGPPVVRSFLTTQDFAGKTIIPFNLHGGYGLGDSREVITRAAPQARFTEGFVMEGLQERRTTERVREWLGQESLRPK